MQGWGEVLDLTDLNDADNYIDETLFNIIKINYFIKKKEKQINENI